MNRYPFWKYLLLVALLVIAGVYALPNVFGQDPAVLVSPIHGNTVPSKQIKTIQSVLKQHQIDIKSMEHTDVGLLIRFDDTNDQIKACDYIQNALNQNYAVALNLAPRTPAWLNDLGAEPMRLGLDLRGGVHFLLQVETDFAIKARLKGDRHSMANTLRDNKIPYTHIEPTQPHGTVIHFNKEAMLDQAYNTLRQNFPGYAFRRQETGSTYQLKAIMKNTVLNDIRDYSVSQAMTILRNRVNALGTSEAVVQRQGQNYVSVNLPGIQDTARAKQLIGKTATIQFKMVDETHDLQSALEGEVPPGSRVYKFRNEERYALLKAPTILEGSAITYASAGFDQYGNPAVNIRLGGGGERRFHRVTAENVGKAMAVVYVETNPIQVKQNGKTVTEYQEKERVISVATIRQALGNRFQITGLRSQDYAQNLALLLRSGALKAPVHIVQEQTIGPSLGHSNIEKGVWSLLVGSAIVIVFMLLYYRIFGLVADIALAFNVIFIIAILSIIGATLTLPGIAGIVLTVGMAVDANVLIYERIREELRNGMTPQASISAGYDRAFSTIVDANVTTLIVAIVLFALGTSSVRGFAITVIIGLFTSMLTSIYFSRAMVNLIYGWRKVKHLSIGIQPSKAS